MAHIGKKYPVHFRRDANFDVTNYSIGFGQRYTLFVGGVTGSIGSVVGGLFLDAETPHSRIHDLPEWASAPLVVGTDVVVIRAYTVFEGPPQNMVVYMDVNSFDLGKVYTVRLSINQDGYRGRGQAGSGDVVFETPGVCQWTFNQFSSWEVIFGFPP